MSELLLSPRLDVFFGDLVADAQRSIGLELPTGAAPYLAGLLSDYASCNAERDALMAGSLTLQLHASMSLASAHERFVQLRALGDGALYMGSFFSQHFQARGVNEQYVCSIGKSAYAQASQVLRAGGSDAGNSSSFDLFGTLAGAFEGLKQVLQRVASCLLGSSVNTARGTLQAYERWLETSDAELQRCLAALGMVPPAAKA